MKKQDKKVVVLCSTMTVVIASMIAPAWPYMLAVESSEEERRLAKIAPRPWWSIPWVDSLLSKASISVFAEPVHEEITNRMFGCNGDAEVCAGSDALDAPAAVLAGVRWNDDPPFRLLRSEAKGTNCVASETIRFETQPGCWTALFVSANKRAVKGAEFGVGDAMLYRTHFGDLQFLHAMASRDGEPASTTRENILGWLEFSWRASRGEYTLETRLNTIDNPVIQRAFGTSGWRIQDLYTLGAGGGLRRQISDVAFGSFLHTIQDSFAAGHLDREESTGVMSCSSGAVAAKAPGAIRSFHAYNRQDHAAHADADTRGAFMKRFSEKGNVVQFGAVLVDARDRRMTWEEVRPMLECAFSLIDPKAPAGPGDFAPLAKAAS